MRPMMGVWMEDESTVTTDSHGMSRPNGANTGPSFFAGTMPTELSAKSPMGASVGVGFTVTTGTGDGFVTTGSDGFAETMGDEVVTGEIMLVGGRIAEFRLPDSQPGTRGFSNRGGFGRNL